MKNKKIYAFPGMAGSGKSEAIRYLQEKNGWPKVYLGAATFEKMREMGLEENQDNERMAREKLREEYGMGVYAKLALPKIKKLLESNDIVLLESLYSWDEYKILKEEFGKNFNVIAIHTSPATRFARLKNREERPLKTEEELKIRDWSEIENTDKGGPIAMADHAIINEGSRENFHGQIDKIFGDIGYEK